MLCIGHVTGALSYEVGRVVSGVLWHQVGRFVVERLVKARVAVRESGECLVHARITPCVEWRFMQQVEVIRYSGLQALDARGFARGKNVRRR